MNTVRDWARGAARSWTIYYGLALAVLLYLEANQHQFLGFVPEKYRPLTGLALGLGVVILRFKTTVPVHERAPSPPPPPPPQ